MMTMESLGQPALDGVLQPLRVLGVVLDDQESLCAGRVHLFVRESDAHGDALLDGLAVAHHGLVAPLADGRDGGGVEGPARVRIGDDDVAGGAVGRTVNSSSTQPELPRLRVAAGNFGATYSMRSSDFAPTTAVRCAAFSRAAARSPSAVLSSSPLKPMVRASFSQVSAAVRSLRVSAPRNSPRQRIAETLARAGHCRMAAVGVDHREQMSLGVVTRRLQQPVRGQRAGERLGERRHLAGTRTDLRVLERAANGGHLLRAARRRHRRSPASARFRRRCRRWRRRRRDRATPSAARARSPRAPGRRA